MDKNRTNEHISRNGVARVSILIAVAMLAACGNDGVKRVPVPSAVRVQDVSLSDSTNGLLLSGELEPEVAVAVSFPTIGTVRAVHVAEGQAVRKGQILASLETGALEDQFAVAKSKATQAQDAWARMEPMHRSGTLPEIKWVEIETGREQARSMEAMARRNLEDAQLRAPIDGIVARRNVEPGESAPVGTAAFTVVRTETMFSVVSVAEKEIVHVKIGDPAQVEVPAIAKSVQGRVSEIGVQADPLTRTYKVKVVVRNPSGAMKIGMVSRTSLHVPGRAGVPVAPSSAVLVDENDGHYVWVMTDSVVHRRRVRLGVFVGDGLAVDSGLSAGDVVVVSGTPMLSEGIRVRAEK